MNINQLQIISVWLKVCNERDRGNELKVGESPELERKPPLKLKS